ncbi:helix-turn-helix transcriptional regulator [Sulfurospirillum sp. 1612]|uniref:helix-turn-helix transcriptional regulator n=1 Tax=Sulfurospirillum sp. 1612 TaxID=3094835 RepID=UPI002F934013
MHGKNRIKRLSSILLALSKGNALSTLNLANRYGVSTKVIRTDFSSYILPLFSDSKIYYDHTTQSYHAKKNFLHETLLSAEELAIIAILKYKARDKYSDENLYEKTTLLFEKFEKTLDNKLYQKSAVEKIDNFKEEITRIKNAISSRRIITCTYNNKTREIYPLKILNFEGYWYLVIYEPKDTKIKTFHLNSIKNIEIHDTQYVFDFDQIKSFENAINAFHVLNQEPLFIELYVDAKVAKYFLRKPLSPSQRILNECEDGALELEIMVSDFREIIPTIQRYIPHIKVIEPEALRSQINKNIQQYIDDQTR